MGRIGCGESQKTSERAQDCLPAAPADVPRDAPLVLPAFPLGMSVHSFIYRYLHL